MNELSETDKHSDIDVEDMPVGVVFESYHLMVIMFGLIAICVILALVTTRRRQHIKNKRWRWLQYVLLISPLFPFIAIQAGWMTAEFGRQPYVVYPSTSGPDGVYLLTADGTSASVTTVELLVTIILFIVVYILLFVGWARVIGRFIGRGPVYDDDEGGEMATAAEASPSASAATASEDASPSADSTSDGDAASQDVSAPKGGDRS